MAKRRVNIVALVIILFVILLIVGSAFLIQKYQVRRNNYNKFKLGETAFADGNYEDAIRNINGYLASFPDDPTAHLIRAKASAKLANKNPQFQKEALECQEKALRYPQNRKDPEILHNLADLCKRMHRFDDAIKHYTALTKEYPNDMKILLDMAECKVAINKYREALDNLSMLQQDA